jgi:hypothetical protein
MSGAPDVEAKQTWFLVGLKVSRQSAGRIISRDFANVLLFTF